MIRNKRLGSKQSSISIDSSSTDSRSSSLNTNQTATNPLDYSGQWENHEYQPSPENWRFPVYTIFLDRFVNGDPTNDDANGTAYEHDLISNQFRNGGDVKGLMDSLDYLQGMGIKVQSLGQLVACADLIAGSLSRRKPTYQPTLGSRQL